MVEVATVINTALSILSGLVYMVLGRVISRREVPSQMRPALQGFAAWWYLLGVVNLLAPVSLAMGEAGAWTLPAYMTYQQTVLFAILAALGGLVYYLTYLYTGRRSAWVYVLIGYTLFYLAILAFFNIADPVALIDDPDGGIEVEYANDIQDSAFATVLGLLLVLPPIVAALAYLSLLRKATGRSQRFRIASVALAFIVWFGVSLIGGQFLDDAFTGSVAWRIITSVVALLAAAVVYAAFKPPRWLQRALHIEGYGAKPTEVQD